MGDELETRLKNGLDAALNRPKTQATPQEVAQVNRFVFAANVIGPIKKLFERSQGAGGIQVIDPAERDAVTHTMGVALEKLANETATRDFRRKERAANRWARQAAKSRKTGKG
ncbi:hypothetical protein KBC80_02425 [Candidatus Woesebacteria bacterium]|nr:hypothetical protein [Candidatus Woesebacteria bacterium]